MDTVANYFIARAHEVGDPITHLKLQKLAYYAEAWHLALYDKPLTGERFEAWVHGPVSPTLYQRFVGYRWSPIEIDVDLTGIEKDVAKHLEEVWEVYGGLSAWDLERMTHRETPWIEARKGLPADAACNETISPKSMRKFYRTLLKNDSASQ